MTTAHRRRGTEQRDKTKHAEQQRSAFSDFPISTQRNKAEKLVLSFTLFFLVAHESQSRDGTEYNRQIAFAVMSNHLVACIVTTSLLMSEMLLPRVTGSDNSLERDINDYYRPPKSHHRNYFGNQHRHQHAFDDANRDHRVPYNFHENRTASRSDKSVLLQPNYMLPVKHRHAKRRNRHFLWHSNLMSGHHMHSNIVADDRTDSRLFIDMDMHGDSGNGRNAYEHEPIHWPIKKESIMEGDLILGGLMMVHSREDSMMCGPIMPQGGIQALEAMLYTLDRINEDKILLPNITIGAHILDDCDRDSYGLEMAVDFIKGMSINHYSLHFVLEKKGRRWRKLGEEKQTKIEI